MRKVFRSEIWRNSRSRELRGSQIDKMRVFSCRNRSRLSVASAAPTTITRAAFSKLYLLEFSRLNSGFGKPSLTKVPEDMHTGKAGVTSLRSSGATGAGGVLRYNPYPYSSSFSVGFLDFGSEFPACFLNSFRPLRLKTFRKIRLIFFSDAVFRTDRNTCTTVKDL